MNQVSRSSKVPLYYQLYEILHEGLQQGRWQPEQQLPTEAELEAQYDVSRATVRQAFDLLVNQGWVYRRRGQGTFVSRPAFEQNLNRIVSFWQDMHQRGLKPGTRVLASELLPAGEQVADALAIELGEELASLVRLRLADDEPLSIEHSLLVHRYCPGVLNQDYENQSLRKTLADQYNMPIVAARQKIRAVAATDEQASLLSIEPNDPLLYIERISLTENELPVEFLRIHLRGDRYTFHSKLQDY